MLPPPPTWKKALLSVGVTGTNGKTSTTRFVAAALGALGRPVPSTTTVGSFLDDVPFDVPRTFDGFLSVLRAGRDRGARYAAIEMTSEALAKGFARAWPCEVGVFTNLTHDHLETHGSVEHYLASKAQLFMAIPEGGAAVLNGCDPSSSLIAEVVSEGVSTLRYGAPHTRGPALAELDLVADAITPTWDGTTIAVRYGGSLAKLADAQPDRPDTIAIRAIGAPFAENALGAWLAAIRAGASIRAAADALARVVPPKGRFEVVADEPHVVVDYAHTPDALARTLGVAKELCQPSGKRLTVVFGAGGKRDRGKRALMGAASAIADRVILTSDNPRNEDPREIAAAIHSGIPNSVLVEIELDREKAITRALLDASPDDVIVIAGKGHETDQTIGGEVRAFSDPEVVRRVLGRPSA